MPPENAAKSKVAGEEVYRSGCLGLAEPCARDAGMSSFFGAPPRGAGSPTPGDNEVVEMDRAVNVVMKVMAEKEQLQKDYDALREEMLHLQEAARSRPSALSQLLDRRRREMRTIGFRALMCYSVYYGAMERFPSGMEKAVRAAKRYLMTQGFRQLIGFYHWKGAFNMTRDVRERVERISVEADLCIARRIGEKWVRQRLTQAFCRLQYNGVGIVRACSGVGAVAVRASNRMMAFGLNALRCAAVRHEARLHATMMSAKRHLGGAIFQAIQRMTHGLTGVAFHALNRFAVVSNKEEAAECIREYIFLTQVGGTGKLRWSHWLRYAFTKLLELETIVAKALARRAIQSKALASWSNRRVAACYRTLRDRALKAIARRRNLRKGVGRMQKVSMGKAMNTWSAEAAMVSWLRGFVIRSGVRVGVEVAAAFRTWTDLQAVFVRREATLAQVGKRWMKLEMSFAWSSWANFHQEHMQRMMMTERYALKWMQASMLKAHSTWTANVRGRREQAVKLKRHLSRWVSGPLSKAFNTIADSASASIWLRKILRRAGAQADGQVVAGFNSWHVAYTTTLKVDSYMKRSLGRWTHATQTKVFAIWKDSWSASKTQSSMGDLLRRRSVLAMVSMETFQALNAWKGFAADRKRQRTLLTKHLNRIRMSKCVAIINAWSEWTSVRRSHKKALMKMGMSMSIHALSAMNTWKAVYMWQTRQGVLVSKYASRMVRSKQVSAFNSIWEFAVCMKHQKAELGITLKRWSNRAAFQGYNSWFAQVLKRRKEKGQLKKITNWWRLRLAGVCLKSWRGHTLECNRARTNIRGMNSRGATTAEKLLTFGMRELRRFAAFRIKSDHNKQAFLLRWMNLRSAPAFCRWKEVALWRAMRDRKTRKAAQRFRSKNMVAAWCTWGENLAWVADMKVRLRKITAAWKNATAGKAFRALDALLYFRRSMRSVGASWEYRLTEHQIAGFSKLASFVKNEERKECNFLKFGRRLAKAVEMKAFNTWVTWYASQRRLKQAALKSAARMRNRALCQIYDLWSETAEERARRFRLLEKHRRSWKERCCGAAFRSWAFFSYDRQVARRMLERLLRRVESRDVADCGRGFVSFKEYTLGRHRTEKILANVARRWKNIDAASAFGSWVEWFDATRHFRCVAGRIYTRWSNRVAAAVFDSWVDFAAEAVARRVAIKRVTARWQNREVTACMAAWDIWREQRSRVRHVLGRMMDRVVIHLMAVLSFWADADNELARRSIILAQFAVRFTKRQQWTSFVSWTAWLAEVKYVKGKLRWITTSMKNREALQGYRTWHGIALWHRRQQAVVKRVGQRVRDRALHSAMRAYMSYVYGRKLARRILRRAGVTAGSQVVGAYNQWTAVCFMMDRHEGLLRRFGIRMRMATVVKVVAAWSGPFMEAAGRRDVVGMDALNRMRNAALYDAWKFLKAKSAFRLRVRRKFRPVMASWAHRYFRSVFNSWAALVDERAFVRSIINRIESRHVLLLTATLMDWLRADAELKRKQVQLAKFSYRFQNRALYTALSSWIVAHKEWMSVKGRMAACASKMVNRQLACGYNTWFSEAATRQRQKRLVQKFGLRIRLAAAIKCLAAWVWLHVMEKRCRRLLLRMGAKVDVGVGQAWTAWRVFCLRDFKVAKFALKLRHMTSYRCVTITFEAWKEDWLDWLDMQARAAKTYLMMKNSDALKAYSTWSEAAVVMRKRAHLVQMVRNRTLNRGLSNAFDAMSWNAGDRQYQRRILNQLSNSAYNRFAFCLTQWRRLALGAADEQKRHGGLVKKIGLRWRRMEAAQAFFSFVEAVQAELEKKRRIKATMATFRNREVATAWHTWAFEMRLRRKEKLILERSKASRRKKAFEPFMAAWMDLTDERVSMRRIIKQLFAPCGRIVAHACRHWRVFAVQVARQQDTIARIAKRMSHRKQWASLSTWVSFTAKRRRAREIELRLAIKWRNKDLSAAFDGWRDRAEHPLNRKGKLALQTWAVECWREAVYGGPETPREQTPEERREAVVKQAVLRMSRRALYNCMCTWLAHFDEARGRGEVLKKIALRMKNRDLSMGYGTWHDAVANRRRQQGLLAKFERKWELRTAVSAIASWTAYATARVRCRRTLLKIGGGGTSTLCHAGFNSWRVFLAVVEQQELHLLRFAQRWGKSKYVAPFATWAGKTAESKKEKARIRKSLKHMLNRTAGAAFTSWTEFTADSKRHRHLLVRFGRQLMMGRQARSVRRWGVFVTDRKMVRRIMTRMCAADGRELSAAFRQWRGMIEANGHYRRRAQFKAWAVLAKLYRDAARGRASASKHARRWAASALVGPFNQWNNNVSEAKRLRTIIKRVGLRISQGCVVRGWCAWGEYCDTRQHQRKTLMRMVDANAQLAAAGLRDWHNVCVEASRVDNKGRRVLLKMRSRVVAGAMDAWVEATAATLKKKEVVAATLSKILNREKSMGYNSWYTTAHARVRMKAILRRVGNKWKLQAAAAALAGWAYVVESTKRVVSVMSAMLARYRLSLKVVISSLKSNAANCNRMARFAAKWRNRPCAIALAGWADAAEEARAVRARVALLLRKWKNKEVATSFGGWDDLCAEERRRRFVMAKFAATLRHACSTKAFRTWAHTAVTRRKGRKILLRLGVRAGVPLQGAFRQWIAAHASFKSTGTVRQKFIKRWRNLPLLAAFGTWRDEATEMRRVRLAMGKVALKMRNRGLSMGYRSWYANAVYLSSCQRRVHKFARSWKHREVRRAMDAWSVLMEMAKNARHVVSRIGSNAVLRLTSALVLWSSAEKVLTKRHNQLKRFGLRIRSKPLGTAFFSWCAAVAEHKTNRTKMKRASAIFQNRDKATGYRTWYEITSLHKRQKALLERAAKSMLQRRQRMALEVMECNWAMRKLCRRVLLRAGAKTGGNVVGAWSQWREVSYMEARHENLLKRFSARFRMGPAAKMFTAWTAFVAASRKATSTGLEVFKRLMNQQIYAAWCKWRDDVAFKVRVVRKVRPVLVRWLNGKKSAAFEAWADYVLKRGEMRLFVKRTRSRIDSLVLSIWALWLLADAEFIRQRNMLAKFSARFKNKACYTAFSSWAAAHKEWMSIKGRMASAAQKMVNRELSAGYNTWYSEMSTRRRQHRLVKKFGAKLRLAAAIQCIEAWVWLHGMEKRCRRLLLRMGAKASVHVGQCWTAWRVFCLRDKKVAYFAHKLKLMTSHRAVTITFEAWKEDWLDWLDMQARAAKTYLMMKNSDTLKAYNTWSEAAVRIRRQAALLLKVRNKTFAAALFNCFEGWAVAVSDDVYRRRVLNRISDNVISKQCFVLSNWNELAKASRAHASRSAIVARRFIMKMRRRDLGNAWEGFVEECLSLVEKNKLVKRMVKQWASSELSGAYRTWFDAAVSAKRAQHKIDKLGRSLAMRTQRGAVFMWKDWFLVRKRVRGVLARMGAKAAGRDLWMGIHGWRSFIVYMDEQRKKMESLKIRPDLFFAAWADLAAGVKAEQMTKLRIAARMFDKGTAPAFETWQEVWQEAVARKLVMARVAGRIKNRAAVMALESWRDWKEERGRHRNVLKKVSSRADIECGHALRDWASVCEHLKKRGGVMKKFALRLASRQAAAAWSRWAESNDERSVQKEKVRMSAAHWINKGVTAAWTTWSTGVAEHMRQMRLMKRFSVNFHKRCLVVTFAGWVSAAADAHWVRGLICKLTAGGGDRNLLSGWNSWKSWWAYMVRTEGDAESKENRARQFLLRLLNAALAKTFLAWKGDTVEHLRHMRLMKRFAVNFHKRCLVVTFAGWVSAAADAHWVRGLICKLTAGGGDRNLLAGWNSWKSWWAYNVRTEGDAASKENRARQFLLRLLNAALAKTFLAWKGDTADEIRHRTALAKHGRHWINRHLAAVYGQWLGCVDTSRRLKKVLSRAGANGDGLFRAALNSWTAYCVMLEKRDNLIYVTGQRWLKRGLVASFEAMAGHAAQQAWIRGLMKRMVGQWSNKSLAPAWREWILKTEGSRPQPMTQKQAAELFLRTAVSREFREGDHKRMAFDQLMFNSRSALLESSLEDAATQLDILFDQLVLHRQHQHDRDATGRALFRNTLNALRLRLVQTGFYGLVVFFALSCRQQSGGGSKRGGGGGGGSSGQSNGTAGLTLRTTDAALGGGNKSRRRGGGGGRGQSKIDSDVDMENGHGARRRGGGGGGGARNGHDSDGSSSYSINSSDFDGPPSRNNALQASSSSTFTTGLSPGEMSPRTATKLSVVSRWLEVSAGNEDDLDEDADEDYSGSESYSD